MSADWLFEYTSHLGYLPPDYRPQFGNSAASPEPDAHVDFAAGIGMAGVLYPWAVERPPAEVARVRSALERTGLRCSCIVSTPVDEGTAGLWSERSEQGVGRLERQVVEAAKVASSLGSSALVALPTASPESPGGERELEAVAANLGRMASVAADHGLTLDIEPMDSLPGSLIRDVGQALETIAAADHRAVGLVFDTGHVARMDGDLVELFDAAYDRIHLLQFADEPGRVEPGAGTVPIVEVAVAAKRRGYGGLVDLEFRWSDDSEAGEVRGLEGLRRFDREARLRVRALQ